MMRIAPCNDEGIRLDKGACIELAALSSASSVSSRNFSSEGRSAIGRSEISS